MNEPAGTSTDEDLAWASIETPLPVAELKAFCNDIERLYRINPMLVFERWEALGQDRYAFRGSNTSQEPPFDFELELSVSRLDDGIRVDYDRGVRSSTRFTVEPAAQGSRLTITDRYERLPADQRAGHLHEVDKSLTVWARYLQQYLLDWQRWSRFGLWRWYMRRVWQPMKPAGRRITYILLWITALEIALIVLGAGIYYVEYADR